MKNILVVGGAGFLGSHLCKRLLEKKNKVICVDNLYTGREINIAPLRNNSNFSFINHDIIQPLLLEEKVDEIYNLACPASPPHYQKDPFFTLKTSVLGTLNLIDLAKKNKAKLFLSSTSEVYGNPEIHPQKESYFGNVNCTGPRACYDEGKRCAETLMFDYNRMTGNAIKVVRIFNTYGPNMDPKDGRVVSNFILQALRGEDITIFGDGKQTRSFCFASDQIDGWLALMNSKNEITGPINIGNPKEITMLELAEEILSLTNSKSKIIFKDLPKDDPKRRRPDISQAKEKLNWEPKISLKEGLEKTIEYFKNHA
ncbi:MAG: UDP-glucuronic acid decarboxylase family protein [Alphaproteobacteria bacterium]